MIYIKENPVGVDVVINDIQRNIYESLGWVDYNAYHRVYKNEKSTGGVVPDFYTGENDVRSGEYKEVLLDDNLAASSFFYTDDTITTIDNGFLNQTNVHFICQVDLNRINGDNKRSDEAVHRDVVLAVNNSIYGKVSATVTGISSVYSEFDTTQITWDDMQPFHCFRVDIAVTYRYDCCDDCRYESPITGNEYIIN